MIDVELLRKEPEQVKKGIKAKKADPALVDTFLTLDTRWREAVSKLDEKRAKQKKFSEARDIEGGKKNKEGMKELEFQIDELARERDAVWMQIPNPPLENVIIGESDADNKVLREVGERTQFDFSPKDYLTIAESLGVVDMARAAKVSGSRFGYILGDLARLELALAQFVFETLGNESVLKEIASRANLEVPPTPFTPVLTPVMIGRKAMASMGYMERGTEEIYHLPEDDLYLIGTSEQAIGPMHQDEIFETVSLPKRYVGFSACFRREAGSYGKDTKGILRVHQFNKTEMFSFVAPENSIKEHQFFLAIEEYLMQQLELPYHVLDICSADLGDPAAAKYDVEAWLPGQNGGKGEYRETHSTSNTTDFQSRRLNIRYRKPDGVSFVHLVNGTAFSERPLIAIIENFQEADGSVRIPKALQKWMGKERIIKTEK